jgi:hypothetical protein
MLRHSLFKYYDQRIWAEKFLDGEMLFRSLAYFHDCEDAVRLEITNQTQGTQFTVAEYAYFIVSHISLRRKLCYCVQPTRKKFDARSRAASISHSGDGSFPLRSRS